jgi:repressor LexA
MDVEQLKKLMRERKETQAGIARLLGITPDKLSKTMSGKRNLKLEEGNVLRRYFGLDSGGTDRKKAHLLPIVGLVSAGAWREGFEHVRGHMPSPDPNLSRNAFVVIVEGDSMDRVVGEGEAVIVDPRQRELLPKRYYVVRNASGETTFKQYLDQPARLEPCSHNPEHRTIYPGQEEFTIVGRVMKAVRDL